MYMGVRWVQHVGVADRIILTSPGPLMLDHAYLVLVLDSCTEDHDLEPRVRFAATSLHAYLECLQNAGCASQPPSA